MGWLGAATKSPEKDPTAKGKPQKGGSPPRTSKGKVDSDSQESQLPVPVASSSTERRKSKGRKSKSSLGSLKKSHKLQKGQLPWFLKGYAIGSIIIFILVIVMSIAYLVYVQTLFFNPLLHIQYEPVIALFGYNAYNLQCLFVGMIIAGMFMYHVIYRVHLEDSDFFGWAGVVLLFSMVMVYDATGVYHLYEGRVEWLSFSDTKRKADIAYNLSSDNELSWTYAWSTKPSCARYHANFQGKINKQKQLESEEVPGPQISRKKGEPNHWLFRGQSKPRNAEIHEVSDEELHHSCKKMTTDCVNWVKQCNKTSESIEPVSTRGWMKAMQNKLGCCGPRGYNDWKYFVKDVNKCPKKTRNGGNETGCAVPFSNYLKDVYLVTAEMMYAMSGMYLLMLVGLFLHFAAMKYTQKPPRKVYSLLDLTEPEHIHVIDTRSSRFGEGLAIPTLSSKAVTSQTRRSNLKGSTGGTFQDPRYAFSSATKTHVNSTK